MTPVDIVIDTSVARACGKGNMTSSSPAPECIEALNAIGNRAKLKRDMRVAMSPVLKDEWVKHATQYAVRWLGQMIARKCFVHDREPWDQADALEHAAGRLDGGRMREVMKDAHVVGLAMRTGQRVVSLDDRQRMLLSQLCTEVPDLCELHWANPARDEGVVDWLQTGAPTDRRRCIGGM